MDGPTKVLRVLTARMLVVDLVLSANLAVIWSLTGLMDMRLAALLSLLRTALWIWDLRRRWAPLLGLSALEQVSDEQLRDADTYLQSYSQKLARHYGLGWFLGTGVAVGAGGGTQAFDVAAPERIAVVVFVCGALVLSVFVRPVLDLLTEDFRRSLALELRARRVATQRPKRSLADSNDKMTLLILLSLICPALFGELAFAHVARAHAIETQLQRVEICALRVATDQGQLESGCERVGDAALLPAKLREALVVGEDVGAGVFLPRANEVVAARPLPGGGWVRSRAPVEDHLGLVALATLFYGICGSLFLWGLGRYQARALAGSVGQLRDLARDFTEHGELRALERVTSLYDDELGELATYFAGMLDVLEELTAAAEAVSRGDLRATVTRPGDLHEAFRGMLTQLHDAIVRLRETSVELASAATEILAISEQQERAAAQQISRAQAIEGSVRELASSAEQVSGATARVVADARESVRTSVEVGAQIGVLREHATGVRSLLERISEIADRSDLLALNGSLEAVRAGEVGRGFALVAAEMRRLAERVSATVADVSQLITNIDHTSAEAVEVAAVSEQFGAASVEAAQDIAAEIRGQSGATSAAAERVLEVAGMIEATAQAIGQTRSAALGLQTHARELERLLDHFEVREDRGS